MRQKGVESEKHGKKETARESEPAASRTGTPKCVRREIERDRARIGVGRATSRER